MDNQDAVKTVQYRCTVTTGTVPLKVPYNTVNGRVYCTVGTVPALDKMKSWSKKCYNTRMRGRAGRARARQGEASKLCLYVYVCVSHYAERGDEYVGTAWVGRTEGGSGPGSGSGSGSGSGGRRRARGRRGRGGG